MLSNSWWILHCLIVPLATVSLAMTSLSPLSVTVIKISQGLAKSVYCKLEKFKCISNLGVKEQKIQ